MNTKPIWTGLVRDNGSKLLIFSSLLATLIVGCGGQNESSSETAPTISAKPVIPVKTSNESAKAKVTKIAIIRLSNPDFGSEALDKDIEAGIKQSMTPHLKYVIMNYDAKGELNTISDLVDKSLSDGADVIVTLLDTTTDILVRKKIQKPVVFAMANQPIAMGLGKSDTVHEPNITGAYLSHHLTLTVEIARGSLPKATKMAVLFDPSNSLSVIHKDALLRCNWANVESVVTEYEQNQDWPKLMKALKSKDVSAVLLTNGLGSQSQVVIAEAEKVKLPVFGTLSKQAEQGAIFTREPGLRWTGFEVGRRLGRIINGEEAGKIPFVDGDHYVTVVNTEAAKRIGVIILPAIMRDIKDVGGKSFVGATEQ